MYFPSGKLDPRLLDSLLKNIPVFDSRIKIGPRIGEDTAVIDMGKKYLLLKSDPITFTADRIGWYSVHINANDIATMGGTPCWFLATLLLPEKRTTKNLIKRILTDLTKALTGIKVTLCGGHTEVTPHLDRPIIVGMMVGEVPKNKLVLKDTISAGDRIIVARGIAIEGTGIIAREKESLLRKEFSRTFLKKAKNFIYIPGISILIAAQIARDAAPLTGMHDPTEGGLLGGLWELAYRQKLGFVIEAEKVFIYQECRQLCKYFNLDPFRLIGSGALIITCKPRYSRKVVQALTNSGIPVSVIGEFIPNSQEMYITERGKEKKVTPPFVDEITKIM